MPATEHAHLIEQIADHFNRGALDAVTPLISRSLAGFTRDLALLRQAFPDARFTIEDILADGDKLADRPEARWVMPVSPTSETTSTLTAHSVVTESVPGQVFRYTAASAGLHADHTFTLTSTPHGTRVLSKETQAGPLPAAGRAVLGPSLNRATQRWLENLAATTPATLASPAQGHGPRT
jgi:hypothetical protein